MDANCLSKNRENIFQSELIMNVIFDFLGVDDRLNLSLCDKKINSIFSQRSKILKTSINYPHSSSLYDIEISLLNNISSKYKNIKKVETSFGSENRLKPLAESSLAPNVKILEISAITSNIDSVGKFINLKELYLNWNYRQDEVTNLLFLNNLPNLEILKLNEGKITDLEPIKGLTKLKELYMRRLIKGNENEKSEQDDDLYYFRSNSEVESLDISPISYLSNLEKLEIYIEINSIEPFRQLINLKELNLSIKEVSDISILSNLVNLKILYLSGPEIKNIEAIKYLVNLEQLYLGGYHIEDFSSLSYLVNLKVLGISCKKFKDHLNQIKGLIKLEKLSLSSYSDLTDISPLSNLINLKNLNLCATKVNDISPLSNLVNLKKLNLAKTKVDNIKAIEKLTKLEELNLEKDYDASENEKLKDISPLLNLVDLRQLNLRDQNIIDTKPMKSLINLKELDLSCNRLLSDITSLSFLINLEKLDISLTKITSIEPLKELIRLKELNISFNKINNISSLSSLVSLEKLKLSTLILINIEPLKELKNLKELDLSYNYNLSDISPLSSLVKLENLKLYKINVSNVEPIKNLIYLKELDLYGNKNLFDISPLSNLVYLTQLHLGKTQVKDYKPVEGIKRLRIHK